MNSYFFLAVACPNYDFGTIVAAKTGPAPAASLWGKRFLWLRFLS